MKWGKTTFLDIINLKRRVDWLSKTQIQKFMTSCAKEMAEILYAMVVKRTPVDTGNLRRNWHIDMHVKRIGDIYEITIYNNTPYASFVEYGHRNKAHTDWIQGRFFLTRSEIELEQKMTGLLERKLTEKLLEVFNAK